MRVFAGCGAVVAAAGNILTVLLLFCSLHSYVLRMLPMVNSVPASVKSSKYLFQPNP